MTDRQSARCQEVFGIFPGAVVARGKDWTWEDQDGGPGKGGRVTRIQDWNGQTYRSVASVIWQTKIENMYRLGHKGKVDLLCVTPASGGPRFINHLPLVGRRIEPPTATRFTVGQQVVLNVDLETLRRIQDGHGGFNVNMKEAIGKKGVVHRITEKGDVRVQYPGTPAAEHRWAFSNL